MSDERPSILRRTTLAELLNVCRLPSGASFELQPDTVEFGLKVAEASDPLKWREKAMQVVAVTAAINGQNVKASGGVEFVCNLLDTDVVLLTMAWTCNVNGSELKFEKPIPCPQCDAPFGKVDLGQLVIDVRDEPVAGAHSIQKLELDQSLISRLPASIRDGQLLAKDPTWREARSRIPINCAANPEVIDVHRALSALMVQHDGKPPRAVTLVESKQFPMRAIQVIITEIDRVVPNFSRELKYNCKTCGVEIDIPFGQAGA